MKLGARPGRQTEAPVASGRGRDPALAADQPPRRGMEARGGASRRAQAARLTSPARLGSPRPPSGPTSPPRSSRVAASTMAAILWRRFCRRFLLRPQHPPRRPLAALGSRFGARSRKQRLEIGQRPSSGRRRRRARLEAAAGLEPGPWSLPG